VEERKVEEKPAEQVELASAAATGRGRAVAEGGRSRRQASTLHARAETLAMPKNDRVAEFSVAGSNAYDALIFGHLQRFKPYPLAAHGASGTVMVQFELDRAGEVISSKVTKSSGNQLLDREALEILHRASPFPAFPTAKS